MENLGQISVFIGYGLSVLGFLMAVLLFSKMRSQHIHPGTTIAWLLGMIFLPYVAIPLYLSLGGRRLRRMTARKGQLKLASVPTYAFPPSPSPVQEAIFTMKDAPPATTGNKVEILCDGVDVYERLMAEIDRAEESIHFTTFILGTDDVAKTIVDALARRAREGIEVCLLVDGIGSFWSKYKMLGPLKEAGGKVGVFMPLMTLQRRAAANLRMHRKMYIFDERRCIMGGKNLSGEYMGPEPDQDRWVDASFMVEGPAVCGLNELWAADWAFATGEKPDDVLHCRDFNSFAHAGDKTIQLVPSGPDAPNDPFYEVLLAAMLHARQRVWITTPYFVPDETILRLLCILAKLGRDVRLITPRRSDSKLPDLARRYPLRELFKAGGKIYFYTPTVLHAKLLLIDDDIVSIGSPNMDMRSLYLNFEVAMFMYDKEEIKEVEQFITSLLPKCVPYTRFHGRVRGIVTEMMENVARILSPLI